MELKNHKIFLFVIICRSAKADVTGEKKNFCFKLAAKIKNETQLCVIND